MIQQGSVFWNAFVLLVYNNSHVVEPPDYLFLECFLTIFWEGCALGETDFAAIFFSFMDVNVTEDISVN